MNRIEANVATQVGDISRPQQVEDDRRHQAQAAERLVENDADAAASAEPTSDEIKGVLAAVQQVVETATGKALAFDIEDNTNDLVVTVSDRATEEIIKQIPTEEVLGLRERLRDLVGLMVDKTA